MGGGSGEAIEELLTETKNEAEPRFLLLIGTNNEVLGTNVKWHNLMCFDLQPWELLRMRLVVLCRWAGKSSPIILPNKATASAASNPLILT